MNYYNELFTMINNYIFGGTLTSGTAEYLVASLFSLCACMFCVALPFIIVWCVIRLVISCCAR